MAYSRYFYEQPALEEKQIWFEKELLQSNAYRELKTTACYVVYAIFKTKCQMEPDIPYATSKRRRKASLIKKWIIKNNGKLEFTYQEAKDKYGISNQKFQRAIADLVGKGFIDITKRCGDSYNEPNLYGISERWRLYGDKKFIKQSYEKATGRPGFKNGNQYGKNCDEKVKENYRKDEQNAKNVQNHKKQDKVKSELERLESQKDKFIRGEKKLSKILDKGNCKDEATKKQELRRIRKQLVYNEEAIKSKAQYLKRLTQ